MEAKGDVGVGDALSELNACGYEGCAVALEREPGHAVMCMDINICAVDHVLRFPPRSGRIAVV